MRTIEIPKLKFSKWHYWADRTEITNINYPGIYLLAITNQNLTAKTAKYEHVSYIGMTNSISGLRGRLGQLHSSINGGTGHSGGNTIRRQLGLYEEWGNGLDLYVSVCPVICDTKERTPKDLQLMGAISYMEYEAFALFKNTCPKQEKPQYNTR